MFNRFLYKCAFVADENPSKPNPEVYAVDNGIAGNDVENISQNDILRSINDLTIAVDKLVRAIDGLVSAYSSLYIAIDHLTDAVTSNPCNRRLGSAIQNLTTDIQSLGSSAVDLQGSIHTLGNFVVLFRNAIKEYISKYLYVNAVA